MQHQPILMQSVISDLKYYKKISTWIILCLFCLLYRNKYTVNQKIKCVFFHWHEGATIVLTTYGIRCALDQWEVHPEFHKKITKPYSFECIFMHLMRLLMQCSNTLLLFACFTCIFIFSTLSFGINHSVPSHV